MNSTSSSFFPTGGNVSDPERVILAREEIIAINKVLENMPDNRRRAFLHYRFEGLSAAEIGRRLGISRPGAAKHIARAIAEIDGLFNDDSGTLDR